ncbi:MAG: mechanosensitive ion channel domain-containing protein [Polyangiales bacterium]
MHSTYLQRPVVATACLCFMVGLWGWSLRAAVAVAQPEPPAAQRQPVTSAPASPALRPSPPAGRAAPPSTGAPSSAVPAAPPPSAPPAAAPSPGVAPAAVPDADVNAPVPVDAVLGPSGPDWVAPPPAPLDEQPSPVGLPGWCAPPSPSAVAPAWCADRRAAEYRAAACLPSLSSSRQLWRAGKPGLDPARARRSPVEHVQPSPSRPSPRVVRDARRSPTPPPSKVLGLAHGSADSEASPSADQRRSGVEAAPAPRIADPQPGQWPSWVRTPAHATATAKLVWLLGFIMVVALVWWLGRLRAALPRAGLLPRTLVWSHGLARAGAVLLALRLLWSLVPASLDSLFPWLLLALTVTAAWAARGLLQDAWAGLWLVLEHRIRPGMWLQGPDFAGVVLERGLRVTWLIDPAGARIAVPHRCLLRTPLQLQRGRGATHRIELRLHHNLPAAQLRRAILEALALSPWLAPGAELRIGPDPADPSLWQLWVPLVDSRFLLPLRGQLHERVEARLGAQSRGKIQ